MNNDEIEDVAEEIIEIFKGYQYEISTGFTDSPFWDDIGTELRILLRKIEKKHQK